MPLATEVTVKTMNGELCAVRVRLLGKSSIVKRETAQKLS